MPLSHLGPSKEDDTVWPPHRARCAGRCARWVRIAPPPSYRPTPCVCWKACVEGLRAPRSTCIERTMPGTEPFRERLSSCGTAQNRRTMPGPQVCSACATPLASSPGSGTLTPCKRACQATKSNMPRPLNGAQVLLFYGPQRMAMLLGPVPRPSPVHGHGPAHCSTGPR